MRGESGLYLRLLPVSNPDSVARAGYLAFALGWRVMVPGWYAPMLALALRLTPHRIVVPIVGLAAETAWARRKLSSCCQFCNVGRAYIEPSDGILFRVPEAQCGQAA